MVTRTLVARCAVVLLVGSVAACADDEPTAEPDSSSDSTTAVSDEGDAAEADGDVAEAGDEEVDTLCANAEEFGNDLTAMLLTDYDDPPRQADQIRAAAEHFTAVEPPEQVAAEWQAVSDLLTSAQEVCKASMSRPRRT
jgi:hypothetical protein